MRAKTEPAFAYLFIQCFGGIYYVPSAVLSAENTSANDLSPQEANVVWGMQTDKSTMTQQGEMCHGESTWNWVSTGAPNSVLGGQRGFQQGVFAEDLGNISK